MRKPRDYDAELKAISARAKQLQERKLRQLGELVVAAGADALPIEQLAGALAATAEANDGTKEAWRRRGARLFQRTRRQPAGCTSTDAAVYPAGEGGTLPLAGGAGKN
jgi:DNA-binding protein H-NS